MPDDKKLALSRRQLLGGLGAVGAASAGAGLGTTALFSDEESFNNNTIQAGTTNLQVTAGIVENGINGNGTIEIKAGDPATADGDALMGLTVKDIKPGDWFMLRTTVNVENNPMYVAAQALNADDAENGTTEPEEDTQASYDPDTGGDAVGDGTGGDAGDLDNELKVTMGYDSDRTSLHDNNLEGNLVPESTVNDISGTDYLARLQSGYLYRGRRPASGGGTPYGGHGASGDPPTRIGGDASETNVDREAVTHFHKFVLPDDVGNEVQGDSLSWDIEWRAEQVRNNADPSDSSQVDGSTN